MRTDCNEVRSITYANSSSLRRSVSVMPAQRRTIGRVVDNKMAEASEEGGMAFFVK